MIDIVRGSNGYHVIEEKRGWMRVLLSDIGKERAETFAGILTSNRYAVQREAA